MRQWRANRKPRLDYQVELSPISQLLLPTPKLMVEKSCLFNFSQRLEIDEMFWIQERIGCLVDAPVPDTSRALTPQTGSGSENPPSIFQPMSIERMLAIGGMLMLGLETILRLCPNSQIGNQRPSLKM